MRSAYNYDRRKASVDAGLRCEDPSLAQQSQKSESDINVIVKRFGLTGQMPSGVRAPQFGDFTQVGDFRDAMDAIIAAENSFMQMPADVRKRFGNDPQSFLEFCSSADNLDEMRKLGLAVPAPDNKSA